MYVHYPFCHRICPYCDFYVRRLPRQGAKHGANPDQVILRRYLEELEETAAHTDYHTIASVYFGGGTPSLASADIWGEVLDRIGQLWQFDRTACEVTLEANPEDVTEQHLQLWQASGINRLSIGVQSFHDPTLEFLGRTHNGAQARAAVTASLRYFPRTSLDVIIGTPNAGSARAESDVQTAIELGAQHISVYGLTIEPRTAFARSVGRGQWQPMPDDAQAELDAQVAACFAAQGYARYEVSNYARPGQEAVHNSAYWAYHPYVGIGPSAAGRLQYDDRWMATRRHTAGWEEKTGYAELEPLSDHARAQEQLMMGLRRLATSTAPLAPLAGVVVDPDDAIWQQLVDFAALDRLAAHINVQQLPQSSRLRIAIPDSSALLYDAILRELVL